MGEAGTPAGGPSGGGAAPLVSTAPTAALGRGPNVGGAPQTIRREETELTETPARTLLVTPAKMPEAMCESAVSTRSPSERLKIASVVESGAWETVVVVFRLRLIRERHAPPPELFDGDHAIVR